MRIAYICADPGIPIYGVKGCSTHVREVVRALTNLEAEVWLYARNSTGAPLPELAAAKIRPLPPVPQGDKATRERAALTGNAQIAAQLEREGPFDLVYERYSLWNYAGMEYARATGTPGLLEVNAPLIAEEMRYRSLVDRPGAEYVAQRVFAAASKLIAVSEEVAGYLRSLPATEERIHVLPNGVDSERFRPCLAPTCLAGQETFTIGFVGGLKPWHGVSVLLQALHTMVQRRPLKERNRLRLLIVGDGPERENLQRAISDLDLQSNVHFVGAVEAARVPGYLASMDVGVAPYPALQEFYFSPLKVYEYMAMGLPVVASRIGQLTTLIRDEENGLLCPPGDATALADTLERLVTSRALCVRLGRAARQTVVQEFTWEAVARRILALATGDEQSADIFREAV